MRTRARSAASTIRDARGKIPIEKSDLPRRVVREPPGTLENSVGKRENEQTCAKRDGRVVGAAPKPAGENRDAVRQFDAIGSASRVIIPYYETSRARNSAIATVVRIFLAFRFTAVILSDR